MAKSRFYDRALSQLDEMIGDREPEPMEIITAPDGQVIGGRQYGQELRIVRDAKGRPIRAEVQ